MLIYNPCLFYSLPPVLTRFNKPREMRCQNELLFNIAFTKHWMTWPSWFNSSGFASIPDVGKPAGNCKISSPFGIILQYQPRCFSSPEVLRKQYQKKKLPNAVQVFSKQLWITTKTRLTQSDPYLAYEKVAERSFRPLFIIIFLSPSITRLVSMFSQTSWVNLNICRLLAIHNS